MNANDQAATPLASQAFPRLTAVQRHIGEAGSSLEGLSMLLKSVDGERLKQAGELENIMAAIGSITEVMSGHLYSIADEVIGMSALPRSDSDD